MKWKKYNLIDTPELIKQVDDYLIGDNGTPNFQLMAYDTETNGLKLHKTVIIGFSFSVNASQGFYFPLLVWVPDVKSKGTRSIKKVKHEVFFDGHLECPWTGAKYPEFVTPDQVKYPDFVAALLDRWFKGSQLFMWNAPFDINHTFINFGVDLKDNLAVDGGLLAHILNENESLGLKENAVLYSAQLGINPWVRADEEKRELAGSIIANGGASGRQVWRANLQPQMKYACADTFLTYALVEVMLREISKERQEKYSEIESWMFDQEVLPICKEVVVDMKRRGVFIDVPHFKKLQEQNAQKLMQLEDEFMKSISPYLGSFDMGKSLDEAVSHQRLVKRIVQLEGLKLPTLTDKKTGEVKESLAKGVVKKEYESNPHWLWGYLIDEDEIKYSDQKILEIKKQLYEEVEGRRFRFNLNSADHLIWLFFDKLGENKKIFPKTKKSTAEDWTPSLEADLIQQYLAPKYPWVKNLLKYKKISKIQSTYVTPALELEIKGWMYMDMKQNGTTSGRFSCSGGYNLQTLPKADDEIEALEQCGKCDSKNIQLDEYIECMANVTCLDCGHVETDIVRPSAIKKGFIAPPGYKIVNSDFSSLEPRCFAYVSGENNIKQVYRDNLDLYSKVYCDIYDKVGKYSADPKASNFLKKVYPKGRKMIKPLVLGIPYGAGDAQCANLTGNVVDFVDDDGIVRQRPDVDKGREIRNDYLNAYPELRQYMDTQEYLAVEYGYVDSKYGRRRHFQWAKVIGDFLHSLKAHNGAGLEKMDKIKVFINTPMSKLKSSSASIKDFRTGNIIFNLKEEDLKELSEKLKMSFSLDRMGNDGIMQKGAWGYIRSLLKMDLNNAKNHPIQAMAGHITNLGMLTTQREFDKNGIDGWIFLQVHDEISAYVRADQAERGKELMQQGMEMNIFTMPLRSEVVMIAEPVICDNLKDSK